MNSEIKKIQSSLDALQNSRKEGNNTTDINFNDFNLGNLSGLNWGNINRGVAGIDDAQDSNENENTTGGTNITINGYDPDVLFSVMNDFSNSFGEIYNESERIVEKVDSTMSSEAMTEVSNRMNGMLNQMQYMMGTVSSFSSNIGMNIEDVSREDTIEDTIGKVANCKNTGKVLGENAIGGIAGQMDIEMMMSEGDIEVNGEATMSMEGTIRLVVRNCENYGTIAGNKEFIGGIGGNMAHGALIDCRNIGNLDALNANYVGGIVGNCNTVIMNCHSKNILAGKNYVGGIAGQGVEVYDSYAFVDIAACTEFGGSILGNCKELPSEESKLIANNFYCYTGKDYGGIDGINYKDATTRMNLTEYLAVENLNEMFKTVNITFEAEGHEDVILSASVGGSIAIDNVPTLTIEEDQMYDWRLEEAVTTEVLAMGEEEEISYLSEKQLKNILFDLHYEADFEPKNMVCQGEEKTEDGKAIILAIGSFDNDTTVKLTDVVKEDNLVMGEAALQNWNVDISNTGVKKLHYRIPEGMDTDNVKLMVKDDYDNWSQREFIVEGSYFVFDFNDNENGFALIGVENKGFDWKEFKIPQGVDMKLIGAVVAAIIVLVFMLVYIKKNYSLVKKDKNNSGQKDSKEE